MQTLKNNIEQLEKIIQEKDKQLVQQHNQQSLEREELRKQVVCWLRN